MQVALVLVVVFNVLLPLLIGEHEARGVLERAT
jgi:hypothetical protein